MKLFFIAATIVAAVTSLPAHSADVGVSISIGQPGFFGQLNIGDFPQPQVINRQPVIIEGRPMDRPPIYLHVPPGHAKHWKRHCHEYNACGERVFFVQDNWYNHEYVPRYQEQHKERRMDRREERRDENRDDRRGDRHEKQRNDREGDDRGRDR